MSFNGETSDSMNVEWLNKDSRDRNSGMNKAWHGRGGESGRDDEEVVQKDMKYRVSVTTLR